MNVPAAESITALKKQPTLHGRMVSKAVNKDGFLTRSLSVRYG